MTELMARGNEFYGDGLIRLDIPKNWKVSTLDMFGHRTPKLGQSDIEDVFEHPIGTQTIRELAKGLDGRIVITCDDLDRPTPAYEVVPTILKQLKEAGVSDDKILFLGSFGCHHPMNRDDFARKIGEEAVRSYDIANHNPFENLVDLGRTSRGTPLEVNKEFSKADLRISICGIKRHANGGAGGSGKSVLPGVSSIRAIDYNHTFIGKDSKLGQWRLKDNDIRLDMQEAARIAKLDFLVNCVVNDRRELCGLFTGDLDDSFVEAVKFAYKQHSTPAPRDRTDIVIVNSYPQGHHAIQGWDLANDSLRDGGTVVNLHYHPIGSEIQHYHEERRRHLKRLAEYPEHPKRNVTVVEHTYSEGLFTAYYQGRPWPVENAGRTMMVSPSYSRRNVLDLSPRVEWYLNWEKAREELEKKHGEDASVTYYPCAALQFNPEARPLII